MARGELRQDRQIGSRGSSAAPRSWSRFNRINGYHRPMPIVPRDCCTGRCRLDFASSEGVILKIRDLSFSLHRLPPALPWQDATHKVTALEFIITRLETTEGTIGTGLSYSVGVVD